MGCLENGFASYCGNSFLMRSEPKTRQNGFCCHVYFLVLRNFKTVQATMMLNTSLESPLPGLSNELLHDYMRGVYQPQGGSELGKKPEVCHL